MGLVRSVEGWVCLLRETALPTELNQQKLTNGRAFCRAPHTVQPYMPVQFWTFHFVKQLGRKAACTQNHRSGLRHSVQLDPVVLVFWAICPSLALFGGGAGPAPVITVS